MSGLKERTRRFWVSTLFLLLGPATLCLTCLAVFWQKTPVASKILNERLASQTSLDIRFETYKRVRPNVVLLTDVVTSKKDAKQASFFCPEIYWVRQVDSSIFTSFVESFAKRRERAENAPDTGAGADFSENPEFTVDESADVSEEESFCSYADDAFQFANNFELCVVPRVYCRDSQLDELKDEIALLTNALNAREKGAVCLVVQEFVCQSDAEFETSTRASDSNGVPLGTNELRSLFRTAALLNPKGDSDERERSLEREVLAFASEYPTLENVRALFIRAQNYSRVDALFELQKIACPQPYFLSWTREADGTSRVEYDSIDVPTPVSFVAKFLPDLRRFGDESYFFGRLRSSTDRQFQAELFNSALNVVSASSQNEDVDARVWTTGFEEFRLCNLQIDDLCDEFSLPGFTGLLTDLRIDEGAIRQGVFLGAGSVKLKNCAVPTRVLQNLLAKEAIDLVPRSAASLRFVNDATPFHEFEANFKLLPSGVVVDSVYENKIVACYQHDKIKYGLFLPKDRAGTPIPYSEPIGALVESQDVKTFWTPLVRDALNHLPISDAAPRNADASDSLLR